MSAYTMNELQSMSDEKLIEGHDVIAKNTQLSLDYYLREFDRRRQIRQSEMMLSYTQTMVLYTRQLRTMTIVIAAATIVNLAVTMLFIFR